ncbi:MAG: polymerase sigma factor, sigma-70 family [Fluviicola sp.]|jgi:RNA polymerase sigma factor (sigma-70 family)|uniref:RNA polymerase sigma factor n=1 Tax=Fluviicola sp. TaxID=1917219 RepID=UPI00260E0082|nr:sigma-70 family RNA polymerase sigma factor [Fluviicola sp.]MDF3028050.1 polymerase sigma factor, sigma-70 family [Fluviicola sp.]
MEKPIYDPLEIKKELGVLYKHFPEVKRLLRTFGCDGVTAEDLFQEALIIYLRKKNDPDFDFQLAPIHFIKQTCKLLWYNSARKEQKHGATDLKLDVEEVPDSWMEKELQYKQLETALTKIGKQCKELLHLFYGLGWNMVDIANKLGMRNDKVAKAQKYRCIQKAKDLVQEAQLSFESSNQY